VIDFKKLLSMGISLVCYESSEPLEGCTGSFRINVFKAPDTDGEFRVTASGNDYAEAIADLETCQMEVLERVGLPYVEGMSEL